nr:DUF1566 domain-containing protein [Vibrio brasiliensis]
MDSIGGSPSDGVLFESALDGDFYQFSFSNANLLCDKYNDNGVAGRTNWRLPDIDELEIELYNSVGNMFNSRGWPVQDIYYSSSPYTVPGNYWRITLHNGYVSVINGDYANFVSCVSEL